MAKKIGNIITSIVMIVLLIIAGILYIPKIFGVTPMVVLSGSMEPTYRVGALVFVRAVDTADLVVGDNVTFHMNGGDTVVTHRIAEINKEAQTMITKGDNNNVRDGELSLSNVIGKAYDFSIPWMGYLAVYLNTTAGLITLLVLVAVCMLISYLLDRKTKKKV